MSLQFNNSGVLVEPTSLNMQHLRPPDIHEFLEVGFIELKSKIFVLPVEGRVINKRSP